MVKSRQEKRGVVIPLSGYLQNPEPIPQPPVATIKALGLFPLAIALVLGLVLGGVSVTQSAKYQEMQQLREQSQKLSKIRQVICN